jgi:hypothetical protein
VRLPQMTLVYSVGRVHQPSLSVSRTPQCLLRTAAEGAWSVMKTAWATSPPAPQTSSPPRCGTSWTASSDGPPSSPDSSAGPDSPSKQNRPEIQTLTFQAL